MLLDGTGLSCSTSTLPRADQTVVHRSRKSHERWRHSSPWWILIFELGYHAAKCCASAPASPTSLPDCQHKHQLETEVPDNKEQRTHMDRPRSCSSSTRGGARCLPYVRLSCGAGCVPQDAAKDTCLAISALLSSVGRGTAWCTIRLVRMRTPKRKPSGMCLFAILQDFLQKRCEELEQRLRQDLPWQLLNLDASAVVGPCFLPTSAACQTDRGRAKRQGVGLIFSLRGPKRPCLQHRSIIQPSYHASATTVQQVGTR